MNRETIIQMAREAGFDFPSEGDCFDYPLEFERFYALAVAKEREACAKVCDSRYMGDNNREDMEARQCAAAIRARGEAV